LGQKIEILDEEMPNRFEKKIVCLELNERGG
jgi:hypothetical protein